MPSNRQPGPQKPAAGPDSLHAAPPLAGEAEKAEKKSLALADSHGSERWEFGRPEDDIKIAKEPEISEKVLRRIYCPPPLPQPNTESYEALAENPFVAVSQDPLSTFSIDVDTASYANVRRFLNQNQLPPREAVRLEELINYFSYSYPTPDGEAPFAVNAEAAACPWNPEHRLVRFGIKAREIPAGRRPPSNLVFLVDVSGSMAPPNKLPLLKSALRFLAESLGENDRVAIVTYAGTSGLLLPSTSCAEKRPILDALDGLQAGGSTNGGAGIQQAYETASAHFVRGGTNRVILATDGDFNVGITDQGELVRLIEERARSGIFLSVLGFGMGNLKDATLEKLADKGNGHYAYIDSLKEAYKVLIEEMSGTLVAVAKDVKVQIEFNPAQAGFYRLIGYENRALQHPDFNDDRKDAGDLGAGHAVTALYEIVPPGKEIAAVGVEALKYQKVEKPLALSEAARSGELLTLKLRWKDPEGQVSRLLEFPLSDQGAGYGQASSDFKFAAAVASFGLLLRDSRYKGNAAWSAVLELAAEGKGADPAGQRQEFIRLVQKAAALARK
ncbi:MAG: VWA domain-containing protein [Planctomycetes bacterium]|nr:VWA domain-containing protein [Planctomycetota bacterium]